MNYKDTCEHCQHEKVAYTLGLNEPLVNAFVRFIDRYLQLKRPLNKPEIGLTNSQYTNFHNLRYHGIIKQTFDGGWIPTDKGFQFYYGEVGLKLPPGS